mgnify:CR=1 FL=1
MHELAAASRLIDVLADAARRAGVPRVLGVRVAIGELSCLDPDTFAFAFEVASRGGPAAGCALEIARVVARLKCRTCGRERGGHLLDACPGCGAMGVDVLEGREARIERVRLEDPAVAAAGPREAP